MGIKDRYKKSNEQTKIKKPLVSEKENKTMVLKNREDKKTPDVQKQDDFPKKIDKVYAKLQSGDAFLEILEDGFNLADENKGYNTKVHFNFIQLDKNDKQTGFLSHYLDLTNFLYLRNMFLTGEYISLEEEERSKLSLSKKYCDSIFSEFKKPDKTISSTFYVTPGMSEGRWMLGVVRVEEGKSKRIQVPVETGRLIGMLELIYLAYQKNLFLKH